MTDRKAKGIAIIDRTFRDGSESPVAYGMKQFIFALEGAKLKTEYIKHLNQAKGKLTVAIGLTNDSLIKRLLIYSKVAIPNPGEGPIQIPKEVLMPEKPEGLVFRWYRQDGVQVLAVAGTDARGLMYGLLELADRISFTDRIGSDAAVALGSVQNLVEFPDHRIRGLDRFIMGPMDDEWFYSDEFWEYYLGRLARCRFNRFVLIAGFDTAYLSPPYPYFVTVPGFPRVCVEGLGEKELRRNLDRLRRIGRACRRHGLEFVFGTWQQTPWTENQTLQVEGLPADEKELAAYCAAGLKTLLEQCEEIDVVHFRVNFEAGMGDQRSNETFWKRLIGSVADCGRRVKLDLRAKGLTDGMIRHALEQGLDVAVPTKYWCEQTGLPHHLTQMRREELAQLDNLNHSRRYSYADLLRKPRRYDMIYRLWNLGSTTLYLWADPDYVRRFSSSCNLGDAAGFEVAAPLSLKGGHAALQREPWPIFDSPDLRSGQWEDERYWLYYLLWGRIGYCRQTDAQVWQRELRSRFGERAAAPLERAIGWASKILPLVTAFHMPMHPMLTYWPELCTGAALFAENNYNRRYNNTYYGDVSYGSTEPSDPGLFYGIDDYARDLVKGRIEGKYTPIQVKSWLEGFASEVRKAVDLADRYIGRRAGGEYRAARLDSLMLADLATYHANKIQAAVSLAMYRNSKDTSSHCYLEASLDYAVAARGAWVSLSDRGSGAYHDPLEFSAGSSTARRGQWKDRIPELDADIAKLEALLKEQKQASPGLSKESETGGITALFGPPESLPRLDAEIPPQCSAGRDLTVKVKTGAVDRFPSSLELRFRHTNHLEGAFRSSDMERIEGGYRAVIPGHYIQKEWDLLVYITGVLSSVLVLIYPGLYHPVFPLPYLLVKVNTGGST